MDCLTVRVINHLYFYRTDMKAKFFKCNVCGNVFVQLNDSGIVPQCCNRPMEILDANITEGKGELHIPCVQRLDCSTVRVVVSRVEHPMQNEHHICFILLETSCGFQVRYLEVNHRPEAIFFTTATPLAVYAYCNIHGLWKATDLVFE